MPPGLLEGVALQVPRWALTGEKVCDNVQSRALGEPAEALPPPWCRHHPPGRSCCPNLQGDVSSGPGPSQGHWLMGEIGAPWAEESGRAFGACPTGWTRRCSLVGSSSPCRLQRAGGIQVAARAGCRRRAGPHGAGPCVLAPQGVGEGRGWTGADPTGPGRGLLELSSPRQLLQQTEFRVRCGPHSSVFEQLPHGGVTVTPLFLILPKTCSPPFGGW